MKNLQSPQYTLNLLNSKPISNLGAAFLNILKLNQISIYQILHDSDYCEGFVINTSKVIQDIESGKLTNEKYK